MTAAYLCQESDKGHDGVPQAQNTLAPYGGDAEESGYVRSMHPLMKHSLGKTEALVRSDFIKAISGLGA